MRRPLSEEEQKRIEWIFRWIDPDKLNPFELEFYGSIKDQFYLDGMLSNKQVEVIEEIHRKYS